MAGEYIDAESLPYALVIFLAELAIGSLWITIAADLRGTAARSFIKFGAALAMSLSAFAFWAAAKLDIPAEVNDYPLKPESMDATRILLAVAFGLSAPYALWAYLGLRKVALMAGGGAAVAGLAAIVALAQVISPPTWGYTAAFLNVFSGALAVGAVTMGMILGHWYLVTPRLSEKPLREVTFLLVAVLLIQGIMMLPNLMISARHTPDNGLETSLIQNPFFWLRIAGGLGFPWVLGLMAWSSSGSKAMQSATGLLYIAMTLVLAGEVLGKGLLFASAVPS